jgi:hypothetical protein
MGDALGLEKSDVENVLANPAFAKNIDRKLTHFIARDVVA